MVKGPNFLFQVRCSSHIVRLICTRAQLDYEFTWDRNKHYVGHKVILALPLGSLGAMDQSTTLLKAK